MQKRYATKLTALVLLFAQVIALVSGIAMPAYAAETEAGEELIIAAAEPAAEALPEESAAEPAAASAEEDIAPAAEEEIATASATVVTPVPYACSNASLQTSDITMSGATYSNAIQFKMGYTGLSNGDTAVATYNFQGAYSSMTFKAGYISGAERDATMTIIADGVTVQEVTVGYLNVAKSYTVSLTGVTQLVIQFVSSGYDKTNYGIVNVQATPVSEAPAEDALVSDEFYYIPVYKTQNATQITDSFAMGGYNYTNGYKMTMGYTGTSTGSTSKVCFNFNNQYRHLTFDIARYTGGATSSVSYIRSAYLTIEADGVVLPGYDELELKWNDPSLTVDVDLTGVTELIITTVSDGYDKLSWYLGDIQLVSDGHAHGVLLSASKATLSTSSPTYDLNPRVYPSDIPESEKAYTLTTDSSIVALVEDDGMVYGRSKGTAVVTATTVSGGHTATCTITSNLSAAKFVPSINAWGFTNFKVDDYWDNLDYYLSAYKRVCGRSLSYAIDDATDPAFKVAASVTNPGIAASEVASTLNDGVDYLWYMIVGNSAGGGLCNGLAISSAITYTGAIPFSTWSWSTGESYANPYSVKTISNNVGYSSTLDMYLKQMIFASHVTQGTASYLAYEKTHKNKFDSLIEATQNFRSTGKDPVVIKFVKNNGDFTTSSHAILPYDVLERENEIDVFVYDPNHHSHDDPDNVYIRFYTDDSGKITSWEFPGYNSSNTKLYYIGNLGTYATKMKQQSTLDTISNYLHISAKSFKIFGGGNELISYSDGVITENEDQSIAFPFYLAGSETSSDDGVTIAILDTTADITIEITDGSADNTTIYYTADSACAVESDGSASIGIQPGDSGSTVTVTPAADGNVTVRYNHDGSSVITSGDVADSLTVKTDDTEGEASFKGYSNIETSVLYEGEQVSGSASTTVSPSGTYVVTDTAELERQDVCPFSDVSESQYYYESVLWAVENGITAGYGADGTLFKPDLDCTRAQVVTFLWRAAGSPEPTTSKNPFEDVTSSDWYYKAVLWAAEEGITAGYGAGGTQFKPNMACTRAQVVSFLHRAAGSPAPASSVNPFTDVSSTAWYYADVLWAVEEGITAGYGAGGTQFRPDLVCSRGQIVTFLYRAYN